MTATEVAERVWLRPGLDERITWTQAKTEIRSALDLHSTAALPEYRLDAVLKSNVQRLWPYCHMEEVWRATIVDGSDFDYIELPYAPQKVVSVMWQPEDGHPVGQSIPLAHWAIYGDRWRWLASIYDWPVTENLRWTMHIIGKCGTPDMEDYCTVPMEYLLPLIAIDIEGGIAIENQRDRLDTRQRIERMRKEVLDSIPRMREPPTMTSKGGYETLSTAIWFEWGQDDVVFDDLR